VNRAKLRRLISKHNLNKRAENILALAGPGLRVKLEPAGARPLGVGKTKFGGLPDLPSTVRWPLHRGHPLTFIAQVNLAEVARSVDVWPGDGLLLFFYDAIKQPWGYKPSDRSSSRVLYVPRAARLKRRQIPMTSTRHATHGGVLPECRCKLSKVLTIPPSGNPALTGVLVSDAERGAYEELTQEIAGEPFRPYHQLFGWPRAVQEDMEQDCQLAFYGVDCGGLEKEPPHARALQGGSSRWQMLLQVGTDEKRLEIVWGDMGSIYFFATAETQAFKKYSETWTVLQCS
jgi:uncharacterized protein YwqG